MERRFLTPHEKNVINSLYWKGYSIRKIAVEIGRSYNTVHSYINRYKTPRLPTREYRNVPDEVISMYTKDKLSIRQIMAEVPCSYGGIHGKLRRNGITLRKRGSKRVKST